MIASATLSRNGLTLRVVLLPGLDGTGRLFGPLVSRFPSSLSAVVVSYPSDRASYSELLPVIRASLPTHEKLIIVAAVLTRTVDVPINNQLMTWSSSAPSADVMQIWTRWEPCTLSGLFGLSK